MLTTDNAFITKAKFISSPHCDDRPHDAVIDMIVIHNISLPPGEFTSHYIEDFFSGKLNADAHPYFKTIQTLRVSSHLLIDRQGDIIQFVPFSKRAWHAGESHFQGRERCNDFSIGIELIGADHVPFEAKQYETLGNVIQALMKAYPHIKRERIVGHSDIAPGRKTDPGPAFDWHSLDHSLKSSTII